MRILIVEDEPPIADDIERTTRALLGDRVTAVEICWTLEKAVSRLDASRFDICLLDLNLSGESGFSLLQQAVCRPSATIVVSAHVEQAIRAYEFGVVDFVPKPFTRERLRQAFERCVERRRPDPERAVRTLVARRGRHNVLVSVADIAYFRAVRCLVEAHLRDGRSILLDKPLDRLEQVLPARFIRTHRTYLVDADDIESFGHRGGGRYSLRLKSGAALPLSRAGRDRLRSRVCLAIAAPPPA